MDIWIFIGFVHVFLIPPPSLLRVYPFSPSRAYVRISHPSDTWVLRIPSSIGGGNTYSPLQSTTPYWLSHTEPRLYFYEGFLKRLAPVPEWETSGATAIIYSLAPPPPELECRAMLSTLCGVAGTASFSLPLEPSTPAHMSRLHSGRDHGPSWLDT